MIDSYHLESYGVSAVNYNRDIEIFPVLNAIFEGIYKENPYKSPTDMGVNMAGNCIYDDEACHYASKQEIIRRYYTALNNVAEGKCDESEANKIALLMQQVKVTTDDRKVTVAAKTRAKKSEAPTAAIELEDGTIITSETTSLLGTCAALLLNALKTLAGIPDEVLLIEQNVIEPIQKLKVDHLGNRNPRLHSDEILIALSICAVSEERARRALEQLSALRGCEVHSTVILSAVDENVFRKLGMHLTCDPEYQARKHYSNK